MKQYLKNHRLLSFLLVAFLFLIMIKSTAQVDTVGNMDQYATPNEEMVKKVKEMEKNPGFDFQSSFNRLGVWIDAKFSAIQKSGIKISQGPGVQKLASTFAWIFGVVAILLAAMKYYASPTEQLMSDLIMTIFSMGIFIVLLTDTFYAQFCNGMSGMFKELGGSFLGVTENSSWLASLGNMLGQMISECMANIPSVWDKGISYVIISVFMFCVVFILGSIAFLLLTLYVNIGNVLLAIAFALGPIFIGLGVWKGTRTFFEKWLNFLLIAGMYQVIASLMLALIQKSGVIESTEVVGNANMLFALLSMATVTYMSAQIPDIANALMPGNIGGMGVINAPKLSVGGLKNLAKSGK